MTRLGMFALAGGLLAACSLVPEEPTLHDLERGKRAAEQGDVARAEYDLVPLARQGYLEAKRELAQLYARQGTRESLEKAAGYYRDVIKKDPTASLPLARVLVRVGNREEMALAASFLHEAHEQGDPGALAALIELYTDHPDQDPKGTVKRLVEDAMEAGTPETESAAIRWYRLHADEPHNSEILIRHCKKAKENAPDCYVDLARHYRSRGAEDALKDLSREVQRRHKAGLLPARYAQRAGWSMVSESIPGRPRPDLAYEMLRPAAENSVEAQVRLARLLIEYPKLDPDADPERMLRKAIEFGAPEAQLALGRLYLNGQRVAPDPAKAEQYLKEASKQLPTAHYYLGRLYERGYLGRPEPVRAVEHYLAAARSGYSRADLALAELYSQSRGVKSNRVNALIFANLAVRGEVPESAQLLDRLRSGVTQDEMKKVSRMVQKELAARRPDAETAAAEFEQPAEMEASP